MPALSRQVVGETALARIVPREALGRVIGVFFAVSRAAIIAGAVLLRSRGVRIVAGQPARSSAPSSVAITLRLWSWPARPRRAQRAAGRRARVAGEGPRRAFRSTVGVPQIVLEQLAAGRPVPARCQRGSMSLCKGAPAHAFYAVVDGRVVVRRNGQAAAASPVLATASASAACSTRPPERHSHHGDGHHVAPGGRPRAARRTGSGASPAARPRSQQHRAWSTRPAGRDGGSGRPTLGGNVTVGEHFP